MSDLKQEIKERQNYVQNLNDFIREHPIFDKAFSFKLKYNSFQQNPNYYNKSISIKLKFNNQEIDFCELETENIPDFWTKEIKDNSGQIQFEVMKFYLQQNDEMLNVLNKTKLYIEQMIKN